MARRRLQMILATTTITVGLAAAPAAAQDLAGLTTVVEDTVSTVEGTTTEVVEVVEKPVAPSGTSTRGTEEPLLDVRVGTEDGTLDVDLQADVAPSDDDGSPQLEVDGGVTVADQHVDVGGVTDPVEDAIDPDPQPAPKQREPGDGNTSTDQRPRVHRTGPGGFLEGGGVVAAGDGTRPVEAPGDDPTARSLGSGFAHGALDHGGFGFGRHERGTMGLDQVPDPEVAQPAVAEAPVEDPQVLDGEFAPDTPAVFASGAVPGTDDGPASGLLKALAAALVLGTGAVWTRATRGA